MEDLESVIQYTKQLKLLYVEDNADTRDATMVVLEEFFDDIVIANDGADGFEKFNTNDINLIITDINMPQLNGIEMSKKIRKYDKDISILILSAYNESEYFVDSIKLGVEGYLIKPIYIEQFVAVLKRVVQKAILKDENEKNLNLLHQYQEITDKSAIVSKSDTKGIITYANDKFCKLSGYSKEELIGKPHSIIRHPDVPADTFKNLWETIKNKKQIWQGLIKNKSKNGKAYYVQSTVKPLLDKNGEILEYIALRYDITDIMNQKRLLCDYIDSVQDPIMALVQVLGIEDIEKFYGQKLYQSIEEKLAFILNEKLKEDLTFKNVFMLGRTHYAFVCDKSCCVDDVETIIKGLKNFKKKIQDTKISIDYIECDISLRISFAYGKKVLENTQYGMNQLIKNNDTFILANNLAEEEQYMARQNLQILKTVKSALEDFRIISYFQPIVDNKTQCISKYESLVRLIDETGKTISPFIFLDITKRGRYYSEITHRVIENSFNALKNTTKDISINLSILDIERESTRQNIFRLLNTHKEHASRVVFELLEDEDVEDFKVIESFISDVKKLGVKIAIDDFGTGYSNFERLVNYKPDILKIDGSLVKNIETSKLSLSVIKTIIAFAKEQKIQTVAEYVENENIFNILKNLGVDYSQGYYFGKPDILRDDS